MAANGAAANGFLAKPATDPRKVETIIAGLLFAFSVVYVVGFAMKLRAPADEVAGAVLIFLLLVGTFFALTASHLRIRIAQKTQAGTTGPLIVPAVLFGAIALYGAASTPLSVGQLGLYAAYLFLPAIIMHGRSSERSPIAVLLATIVMSLPIGLKVLPPLVWPPVAPGGRDVLPMVALVNGACLFLASRPLPGIGFSFVLRKRDVAYGLFAFAALAAVALPFGFATGFLTWQPNPTPVRIFLGPVLIYLVVAVPEEFLFRGVVQNALSRWLGRMPGLVIASILFGFAHLPDWRYIVLASIAGLAYGWVYQRTQKITASSITHMLVDWVWLLALHR